MGNTSTDEICNAIYALTIVLGSLIGACGFIIATQLDKLNDKIKK